MFASVLQEAQSNPESSGRQQGDQRQQASVGNDEVTRNWGFMVCTFIVFFTGLPGVLARAAVYSTVLILGHSSLRQSPSEFAVAVKSLGQTGSMQCAGVPFLEVDALLSTCCLHYGLNVICLLY